jgi:anti-sigma factor RsiW
MTTVADIACVEVVELLTEYLEDARPPPAAEVAAHLADCRDCDAYLSEMRETVRLLGAVPPQPPPEQVRRRLQALFRAWAAHR